MTAAFAHAQLRPESVSDTLAAETRRVSLLERADLLVDPGGTIELADPTGAHTDPALVWTPYRDRLLLLGYTEATIWLRVPMARAPGADPVRWVVATPAFLDDVRLYAPAGGAVLGTQLGYLELAAGGRVPVARRPMPLRETVFPVELHLEPQYFYVRVSTRSTLTLALDLWQPEAYLRQAQAIDTFLGLMLGLSLSGALMGFLGWVWLRKGFFGIIAAYLLCFALLNMALSGQDQLWLYPEHPWMRDRTIGVGAHGVVALLVAFSLAYLQPQHQLPRLTLLLRWLMVLMAAGAIVSALGHYRMITAPFNVLVLVLLPMLAVLYLRMLRVRRNRALLLIVLFMPALLAGALQTLRNLGLLAPSLWTSSLWDLGTLSQVPIATAALLLNLIQEQRLRLRTGQRERSQRMFLDMMAHQLRTPLAVVGAAMANIEPGAVARDPSLAPRFRRAGTALARLDALVGKALAAEEIADDSLALDLQPVAARTLAAQLLDQVGVEAPHRLRVECVGPDEPVIADPNWIGVALQNLVDNAMKYSPGGGEIEVRFERLPQGLRVAVRDRGIGLIQGEHRRIFARFVRGEGARTGIQGSGLGLYLVEQIALRHGGRVFAEDAEGGGSRFTIELPVRARSAAPQGGRLAAWLYRAD